MERPDIIINRLKDFYNEVSNSGKIDKQSILSLEEFIGENLITSKININKVSETPRVMMAEQANQIVEEKIKELEIEYAPPTTGEVIATLQNAYYNVISRLNALLGIYKGNENRVIVPMTSEGIKYRYIENVLTDITTLPVDVVFGSYKDYISDVSSIIHGEDKSGAFLANQTDIDLADMTSISIVHNFYLNLINAKLDITDYGLGLMELIKITPKPITIQDIVTIIENVDYITAILHSFYNEIDSALDAQQVGTLNVNEPRIKALYEIFKFIENSKDSDKLVNLVMRAMTLPLGM